MIKNNNTLLNNFRSSTYDIGTSLVDHSIEIAKIITKKDNLDDKDETLVNQIINKFTMSLNSCRYDHN